MDEKKKKQSEDTQAENDERKMTPPLPGKDESQLGGGEAALIPQEWLYNPLVYSQISGDFSLMQQRVLVGILEKLQERIKKGISYQKQTHIWPSLFDDDELRDNYVLEIDPRSLGIIPANYGYLQEALDELSKIRVAFMKKGKTKDVYVTMPLFARAEMPVYKDKRLGKVRVTMLKENVKDFFDLSMGYAIHMAKVAQLCQKKRTPRIYIFLSGFRKDGERPVNYDDFCKFLGIDEDTARADLIMRLDELVKLYEQEQRDGVEPEKRKGITKRERNERLEKWENPYRKFTKVKSLILEPSRKELDELVRRGEIDFSFTYEPVYENDRKRGNPDKIHFRLLKGDLANEFDNERKNRDSRRDLVEKMCKWPYGLRPEALRDVVDGVPAADFDDFKDYCYRELRPLVEKRQPDDASAYILSLMADWLRKRKVQRQRQAQREDLFAEQQRREHWTAVWQQCHADLLRQTTNDYSRAIVGKLVFESFNETTYTLIIQVQSSDVYKFLERPEVVQSVLSPTLTKHFGKDVTLKYRLMEADNPKPQGQPT